MGRGSRRASRRGRGRRNWAGARLYDAAEPDRASARSCGAPAVRQQDAVCDALFLEHETLVLRVRPRNTSAVGPANSAGRKQSRPGLPPRPAPGRDGPGPPGRPAVRANLYQPRPSCDPRTVRRGIRDGFCGVQRRDWAALGRVLETLCRGASCPCREAAQVA